MAKIRLIILAAWLRWLEHAAHIRSVRGSSPFAANNFIKRQVSELVRVFANEGEPVESVIKRFRRACENEGILQDLKEKQFYKKPSLEKKLQREKALKRMKRKIKKERRLGLL